MHCWLMDNFIDIFLFIIDLSACFLGCQGQIKDTCDLRIFNIDLKIL